MGEHRIARAGVLLLSAAWLQLGAAPAGAVPAFPGAEGFGADAVGGRGGRVIEVTTLADSGPGSLRAALEASGPRIVVFRVGGTIDVGEKLRIENPYCTVAGQTAPGGGIALRGQKFYVQADHVIIRHVRFRLGPVEQRDALAVTGGARHVILDHVSVSWGADETLSVDTASSDVTVQWSFVTEGLLPSNKGSLLNTPSRVTFHHNLWAHHGERLPKADGDGEDPQFQLVNNVMYNWRTSATNVTIDALVNLIGNFYRAGPSTERPHRAVRDQSPAGLSLYVAGNVGPNCPNGCSDEWDITDDMSTSHRAPSPHPMPFVTTQSARDAYAAVLDGAGATRPRRDAVDARIVADVRNGTGRMITHPSEVGGWPSLAGGTPPADSDRDGMPDAWETERGFDPEDPSDGARDADANGYTNVEEYLNELAGGPPAPAPVRPAPPVLHE